MLEQRRRDILQAVECARSQVQTGHLTEAISTLEHAGVSADEAPDVVHFQASIAIALERWPTALSLLEDLTRVLPDDAQIPFGRATCMIGMGRLDESRALLEREEAVRPPFLRYVLLARIAAREGNRAESVRLLREACRVDSGGAFMVSQRPGLAAVVRGTVHIPQPTDDERRLN